MTTCQRLSARVVRTFVACAVIELSAAAAVAQTLPLRGQIDVRAGAGAAPAMLVSERGFTINYPFGLRENFFGLSSGCNADPLQCEPGDTVSLQTVTNPDFGWTATLDGATFRGGCFTCSASFTFATSGSLVLPPLAPAATTSGRYSMTAEFSTGTGTGVTLSGEGTVTLYLRSPGNPTYPNSWQIDRATLWFDSPLPEPWVSADVGVVGLPGSASGSLSSDRSGTFALSGSGADVWGAADAFHFAVFNAPVNQVTARVDGVEYTSAWAKAGVMMRAGFDAASAHALLDVKPDGGVEFLHRPTNGGSTSYLGGAPAAGFPVWLRLTADAYITAEISNDGQNWQRVGRVQASYGLAGLAVTSHDNAVLNHSLFSNVSAVVVGGAVGPWSQSDVGAVSVPGAATGTEGSLTVSGEGADIWGAADAFHYVYQSVGDAQVDLVARVTTLQNTNAYAKAGLMFRADLSASSPHVLLDVKPDGGVEFMARLSSGAQTTFMAGAPKGVPAWLRLHRAGTTFTASTSSDGTSWTAVGSVDVGAVRTGYAGIVVTSHQPGALTTATLDAVSLTRTSTLPASWGSRDIGNTGTVGSSVYSNGTFTVRGAGADIWGTADAFQFAYRADLAHALTARVVSETNTNPYAKAGVMLRQDLIPGSPFVLIDLKPNGELELLYRSESSGQTSYGGGALVGSGVFVRLEQTYDASGPASVTAAYSTDGVAWTTLATVALRLDMRYWGLAVTSHDPGQLNTAVFDQVVMR